MTIAQAFAVRISGRMDEQCPAIQNAIDVVSQAWSGDRRRMLEILPTFPDEMLFNDIMAGWAINSLKLATGMNREQWLAHFSYQREPVRQ